MIRLELVEERRDFSAQCMHSSREAETSGAVCEVTIRTAADNTAFSPPRKVWMIQQMYGTDRRS